MTKVLLVEDDQRIARFIKRGDRAISSMLRSAARGADRCRGIDYPDHPRPHAAGYGRAGCLPPVAEGDHGG
jgi:hypothetical protein